MYSNPATGSVLHPDPQISMFQRRLCGFDSFVHWSIKKKTKLTLNFGGQGVVLDATGCNTLSIYARSLSLSLSLSPSPS